MSVSSDPTFTDTPTLIASVRRDLGEISKRMREADGFAREAMHTMFEIERRQSSSSSEPAAPDAAGDFTRDEMRDLVSDEDIRALLSLTDVGSGRSKLREVLNAALRARSSEPGGGAACWISDYGLELMAIGREDVRALVRTGKDSEFTTPLYTTPHPGASSPQAGGE